MAAKATGKNTGTDKFSALARIIAENSDPSAGPRREALMAMRQAVGHYKKGEWAKAAIAAAEAADADAKYASAYHLLALALDNLGQRH